MPDFVEAVNAAGNKQVIPAHWLDDPHLSEGFTKSPSQKQLEERTETPSESWTVPQLREHAEQVGIDLNGATTKADVLSVINAPTGDEKEN